MKLLARLAALFAPRWPEGEPLIAGGVRWGTRLPSGEVVPAPNTSIMPAPVHLTLLVGEDFLALKNLLTRLDELPRDAFKTMGDLPQLAAAFDLDCLPAVRAGEQRIVLKLSRGGAELLSTLRALEIPSDLISKSDHDCSSVGGLEPASEDRAPAESQGSVGACSGNSQRGDA